LAAPSLDTVATQQVRAWARPSEQKVKPAKTAPNTQCQRQRNGPSACQDDDAAAELEFMAAMQQYKQRSGRMFPTWSEVLEVLQSLGYQKRI
jgi:hypothetical protein